MSMFLTLVLSLLFAGGAEYYRRKKEREVDALMLEGATLSNVPDLHELIAHREKREAVAANIIEIVFNANVLTYNGRNREIQHAEVYIVDDGGGIHVIGKTSTATMFGESILDLERRAEVLAELLGLELVRA